MTMTHCHAALLLIVMQLSYSSGRLQSQRADNPQLSYSSNLPGMRQGIAPYAHEKAISQRSAGGASPCPCTKP